MAWIQTLVGYAAVSSVAVIFLLTAYPETVKRTFPSLFEKPPPKPVEPVGIKKQVKPNTKPKAKSKPKAPEPVAPAPDHTTEKAIVDEEGDNAASFARALQNAQKGTNLKSKDAEVPKPKKRKGKKAEKTNGVAQTDNEAGKVAQTAESTTATGQKSSEPAFTTGASGMATDVGKKTSESLRVYENDVPAPLPREDQWTSIPTKNQRTQVKAAKHEETKKQRQRAAEKERQRAAVVEAEEQRRKLMEKQRRTAREARGEPARNGESYQEISAPSKSVWSAPADTSGAIRSSSDILDTLDAPASISDSPPESRTPVIISSDDGLEEPVNGTEAINGAGSSASA